MSKKFVTLFLSAVLVFGAAGSAYAAVTPANGNTSSTSTSNSKDNSTSSTNKENTGTSNTNNTSNTSNTSNTGNTNSTNNAGNTGTGSSNTSVGSGSALFSDVKSGFWAEKHITKLALEKILLGNNGKFRPNDPVTQQEAVTMAIRYMNLEKEVDTTNSVAFQSGFVVDNYFKPYVALAFSKGLLDKNEEMTPSGSKEAWGSKKASREWITKILVRALNKQAEAKLAMNKATTFADNSKISPSMLGYINVALDLKLTTGMEGNKFNPAGNVTRAQLATFFSRGDQHTNIQYDNVYQGVITNLTDSNLSLYGEDGKIHNFTLKGTSYYTADSETSVPASTVQAYTKVKVIDTQGTAGYVEVIDSKIQLESVEGKFQRLHSTGTKFTVLSSDDYVTYDFDAGTAFLDQNGKAISAKDLAPDSTLDIKRETFSGQKKVVLVQVKSAPVNKSGAGTITAIDVAKQSFKVRDASNVEETLTLSSDAMLLYQDQILKSLSEVKVNDVISYVVKNGQVTQLEVKQTSARTVRGTLINISTANKLVTYVKEGTSRPEVNLLADKVEVVVDGIKTPTIADLIADDTNGDVIEMTITPDDRISKIQVVGRKMEQMQELTVAGYNTKLQLLTATNAKGKAFSFYVTDTTKFDFGTGNVTLKDLEAQLPEKTKVNLTVLGDKVLTLQKVYKYDGKLLSLDTWKQTLTLLTDAGQTMTLSYDSSAVVFVYGKSTGTSLSDVKVGDMISAQLRTTQDKVGRISIKSQAQFEVYSVDASKNMLKIKSSTGYIEQVNDGVALLDENGAVLKASDFAQGQIVNVNFSGNVPELVRKVTLTYGKVESIDAANAKITLKDFSGQKKEMKLTANYQIVRNQAISTNINSLSTSDRVEVRLDADGNTVVRVLDTLSRKFNRYTASSNEIYVQRASLSDNNYKFNFVTNVYVHKGDSLLNLQSLTEGDQIILVFNNNQVIEIEKL
ncbi:S-layer homology domain-containing protein [Paenibacillus guangzhouensis]|uniref:S-layer homology domain-containing protein n=1 Tax=Paenibacillus guangzhouensis TaxID=1473112 RepID=UPI00187B8CE2|nr:S-layer homology domain-containing protein [Paenibacillus guangzhouensis]